MNLLSKCSLQNLKLIQCDGFSRRKIKYDLIDDILVLKT